MTRRTPPDNMIDKPCSICAVSCANTIGLSEYEDAVLPRDTNMYEEKLHKSGYASLTLANAYIRNNLQVQRRLNFKQGLRPKLRDLHLPARAVVCVLGHFIYLDHEEYWSFFDNEDDEVVAVWQLK